MSTLTMTDSYDTQMMDYSGDTDVSMQGSAEGWFNPESIMPEDGVMDDLVDVDNEGVEVDMEADTGENAEFEMIDDAENGPPLDAGLVDVDVYDVSLAASPAIVDSAHVGEVLPASSIQEHSGMYMESPIIHSMESLPQDPEGGAATVAHPQSSESSEHYVHDAPPYTVDFLQEAPDSAVAHLEALAGSDFAYPSSVLSSAVDQRLGAGVLSQDINDGVLRQDINEEHRSDMGQETSSAAHHDSLSLREEVPPVRSDEDAVPFTLPEGLPLGDGLVSQGAAGHSESSLSKQDEGAVSIPSDSLHEPAALSRPETQPTPVVNPQDVEGTCAARETEEQTAGLVEGESSSGGHEHRHGQEDPHRISEGVYIDPPPAVLLTMPEGSRSAECCLFNQPSTSSGTSSPVEEHGDPVPSYTLLLHQRPVLYYEPLRDVFDALRQEEHLTSLPGAATGELCMEAYDMQLVISEDNVFSRDTSLHDLNVLHDGFGIAGPLRLRLFFTPSRFILRYHELREQLGRMAVAGDHGESVADTGAHVATDESLHIAERHAEVARVHDAEAHDTGEHESKNEQGETTLANDEPLNPLAPDPEDTGESVQEDESNNAGEGLDESYDAEEGDQQEVHDLPQVNVDEEGEEDQQNDSISSTTLDADGVHEAPDAEGDGTYGGDYGDYEEYADANEDDDERFGEDLPEELGGRDGAEDADPPEYNIPPIIGSGDVLQAGDGVELPTAVDPAPLPDAEEVEEHSDALVIPDSNCQDSPEFSEQGDSNAVQPDVPVDPSTETAGDADEFNEPSDDNREDPPKSAPGEEGTNGDDQEPWDEDLTDTDATWEADEESGLLEDPPEVSSHKSSKRSFDEVDEDEFSDDEEVPPVPSPDSKRVRRD
ncbi:hypothetical protein OE88DRAFT_989644 [Heliocybe sulcata]|uniref:Uncharacterized protein n=1 Tax=Heliocybe sulcata TaxID=5364 RepID=A0A5C3NBJ0_9AGAM|nr:hypothetical protein OE88DRAFT_989644 [Heliocybe sulcata]